MLVDADGIVSYVSPPHERLFGRSAHETIGKKMFEFVHQGDRERLNSLWQECLKRFGALVRGEARFIHADGSQRQGDRPVRVELSAGMPIWARLLTWEAVAATEATGAVGLRRC